MKISSALLTKVLELVGRPALIADFQDDTVYITCTLTVNPAVGSIVPISVYYPSGIRVSGLPGRQPTYYVRTVMFRLPLDGVESVSTKCPVEKKPTEQEYVNITPVVEDQDLDPMEVLKLTKRLMICTSCGNLRLTN